MSVLHSESLQLIQVLLQRNGQLVCSTSGCQSPPLYFNQSCGSLTRIKDVHIHNRRASHTLLKGKDTGKQYVTPQRLLRSFSIQEINGNITPPSGLRPWTSQAHPEALTHGPPLTKSPGQEARLPFLWAHVFPWGRLGFKSRLHSFEPWQSSANYLILLSPNKCKIKIVMSASLGCLETVWDHVGQVHCMVPGTELALRTLVAPPLSTFSLNFLEHEGNDWPRVT